MSSYHTLLVSCVVVLTGCVSNPVKLEVTQPVALSCGAEPKVDQLHMRKVEPWVIEDNAGITWIGISPDGYENLSTNIADIKKQLKQRVAVNNFYRECIRDFNSEDPAPSE